MGYSRPAAEQHFLTSSIGAQWNLIRDDPVVFARFVEFAEVEAKIDPVKLTQRLRVSFSREQLPTALLVTLIHSFFDEGAHAGLRRFIDDGVQYFCEPADYDALRAAVGKYPGYGHVMSWELVCRREGGHRAYCYYLDTKRNPRDPIWDREDWPQTTKIDGQLVSIFFRKWGIGGVGDHLMSSEESQTETFCLAHDLLGFCFGLRAPGGYSHSIDAITLDLLLGERKRSGGKKRSPESILSHLSSLLTLLRQAPDRFPIALSKETEKALLSFASKYSHFEGRYLADGDYRFEETIPLMDPGIRRTYFIIPFEIERAFRPIVTQHIDAIVGVLLSMKKERFVWHDTASSLAAIKAPSGISEATIRAYLNCYPEPCHLLTVYDMIRSDISGQTPISKFFNPDAMSRGIFIMPRLHLALGSDKVLEPAGAGFHVEGPLVVALQQHYDVTLDCEEGCYGKMVVTTRDAKRATLTYEVKGTGDIESDLAKFAAFARVFPRAKKGSRE